MSPKRERTIKFLDWESSAYKRPLTMNSLSLMADHSIFRQLYSVIPTTEGICLVVLQTTSLSFGSRRHTINITLCKNKPFRCLEASLPSPPHPFHR